MKTIIRTILTVMLALSAGNVGASDLSADDMKYRRSSIYSILVTHNEQKFSKEITEEFLKIPTPDKYNDMNLSVRVLAGHADGTSPYSFYPGSSSKIVSDASIELFLKSNAVASRLVGKWFNRDLLTGKCDMELIKERGLYNASVFDQELAARSTRGIAMLEDAGEELIGNTFVLVNEIKYIDKGQRSSNWGAALAILGEVAAAASDMDVFRNTGYLAGSMVSTIKGFRVKINTRLYRLVWDEETATNFYRNYYSAVPDAGAVSRFNQDRLNFHLEYIGNVESSGQQTSFLGIKEDRPDIMIRKACQRALDENVADLQKKYEQFRIKSPLVSVGPITAYVGKKEGITPDSRFEVLEAQEKDGKTVYKRVGTLRPNPSKIWDNRFMATEEKAYGAEFGATEFIKESGGDFYPGLLIRQIK